MVWNANKICRRSSALMVYGQAMLYAGLRLWVELDPDKWEDLKKNLDYSEEAVERAQQTAETYIPPAGLGIWFEMLRIFLLILLAAILIYLLIRLVSGKRIISRRKRKTEPASFADPDNLPTALSPEEELWEHFRRARALEDYRECLRTLYQIALKKLGDNGWVRTKKDKTNREYLQELSNKPPEKDFARLTAIFEFTWYGEITLRREDFHRYEPGFIQFIDRKDLEKQP